MHPSLNWAALATAMTLGSTGSAEALTVYTDRAAFEAAGTVTFVNDFEDLQPVDDHSAFRPARPSRGVTYLAPGTGDRALVRSGSEGMTHVLSGSGDPDQIIAVVDPGHTMLGFDLGSLLQRVPDDITRAVRLSVRTTRGWTEGLLSPLPPASEGLRFVGYVARPGEYITDFSLSVCHRCVELIALDNVTVGTRNQPLHRRR